MKKKKLLISLALATAVAGVTLCMVKKHKARKRLAIVSDAGYETAYDIHFPLRYKAQKGKR